MREDLPIGIYYDADSVVFLQNVDDRFEELGFLSRLLELKFQFYKPLFRC